MSEIQAPASDTPAAEPSPALRSVESYTPAERSAWLSTGAMPEGETDDEPPAAPPAQDASPAAPAFDVAKIVKTPPPPGVSKRQHERNELVRYGVERDQRIAELEAQLARQPAAPVKSEPAPPPTTAAPAYDGSDPRDPEPTIDQFADSPDPYAAHLKATWKWEQRTEARIAAHAQRQAETQTAQRTTVDGYVKRMTDYGTANPGFKEKVRPLLDSFHPQSPMAAWLLESSVAPQIVAHFADHPEAFARIAQAASLALAQREWLKLELSLDTPSPAADTPAPAAHQQPKTVSTAPAPPTTLGSRPADPGDEEEAAMRRGDFAAFKRIADRKEIARRQGH